MANYEKRISRKDKSVKYRARVRLLGQPPQYQTFDSFKEAKEWAENLEHEFNRQRKYAANDNLSPDRTVAELIDEYIKRELPKRIATRGDVERHLKWWKSEIGSKPLKRLTPALLAECRDKLLRTESDKNREAKKRGPVGLKSPATVTWYMASLSRALTVATNEWGWLESNPLFKVKKPQLPQSRARFLDDDERARLLEACKADQCKLLYVIVVLALSTGARRGEILSLRWRDVDIERGVARLEQTKNKERRALPLTHHALELISQLHAEVKPGRDELVFPRADKQAPVEIKKPWYRALKAAKIENFRFHDLRHSAASYLAMNGATLAEIAEVLGHKTLQMVKRYAHLSEQHTASVVERMNRKVFK